MSDRKRQANRENARRSSGPRSARGKARSSRNARKHGLSVPVLHEPLLAPEVAALARRIAGDREELIEPATAIAEVQLLLLRVRRVRSEVIDRALRDDNLLSGPGTVAHAHFIVRLLQAAETGHLSEADEKRVVDRLNETAPARHARVLTELAAQLAKLDRYERRALSRRKFAIRRFDAT